MQLKINPSKRHKYDRTGGPATFKVNALEMIVNGQSATFVALALSIDEALIYKWKQRTKGWTPRGKKNITLRAKLRI
ncbi:hypothetical protein [Spirosoma pulveris]